MFTAEQGVDDPDVSAAMGELFDEVATFDGVTRVESPYADGGEELISSDGPQAGQIAYANVELPEDIDFVDAADIRDEILDRIPEIDGLRVEMGGFIFAEFEEPSSELFGLAFAIVILIVAFGSVLAMGLPVGVALFGIGVGSALVILFSHVMRGSGLRAVPRDHDRSRCGHRLRAADRDALPRAVARRAHDAGRRCISPSTRRDGRWSLPAPRS